MVDSVHMDGDPPVMTRQEGRAGEADRPTIALLIPALDQPGFDYGNRYHCLWRSVSDAARAADVNLICLNSDGDVPRLALRALVQPGGGSGAIVVTAAIQGTRSADAGTHPQFAGPGTSNELQELGLIGPADADSHPIPMPIVYVGEAVEDASGDGSGLFIDHAAGMREALTHLVKAHHCERIALVHNLPVDPSGEDAYYSAYGDVLQSQGIPFDEDLVMRADAVDSLVDRLVAYYRVGQYHEGVRNHQDDGAHGLDAVVFAGTQHQSGDEMALSLIEALQQRGIRVPEDVRVVGSGDALDGLLASPSLTTVQPPIEALGHVAVGVLLERLQGKPVSSATMPTRLIVRASCGCVGTHSAGANRALRDALQRVAETRRLEVAVQAYGLRLLAAQTVEDVLATLADELPNLMDDIASLAAGKDQRVSCVGIALYDDDDGDAVRLYQVGGAPDGKDRFLEVASLQLLTDHADTSRRCFSLVGMPLTYEGSHLGYLLLDPGSLDFPSLWALSRYVSAALRGAKVAEAAQRRADRLQIAIEAVRTAAAGDVSEEAPRSLAQHIVDTVQRDLALDFSGIFVVDERWAVYWVGAGEGADQMAADDLRLRVGSRSGVGQAALTGQVQLITDARRQRHGVDSTPVLVGDRYLPQARAELALPLWNGAGRDSQVDSQHRSLMGVLSLRSRDPNALLATDLPALQLLADQVAGTIATAEQLSEATAAVRDLQAKQRRYQQQAWSETLTIARLGGYDLGDAPDSELPEAVVRREVRAAMSQQGPVVVPSNASDGDRSALVVPIETSGAAIGALGIRDTADRDWTEDEISLITAVAERMGLAAENLRLLDETRRRVAMERLTQSITARMRQTLDVGQVLQAAVRGFAEAFDAEEVTIRLVSPESLKCGDKEL